MDEAVERARRAQDSRIDALRVLAQHRQDLTDLRLDAARRIATIEAEITAGERTATRSYTAAITAGWTQEELRKIGFPEDPKQARKHRRTPRQDTAPDTNNDKQPGKDESGEDG